MRTPPTILLLLLGTLWSSNGPAIPLHLETNLTSTLSSGLERVPQEEMDTLAFDEHTFAMRSTNSDPQPTFLTIRSVPTGEAAFAMSEPGDDNDIRIVSRCTERLYNLDVDILDAEVKADEGSVRQRSVQIPLAREVFLLDLTAPVQKTNEMDGIMKQVVKAIAEQNPAQPHQKIEGYGNAVISLVLIAIVILGIMAKR